MTPEVLVALVTAAYGLFSTLVYRLYWKPTRRIMDLQTGQIAALNDQRTKQDSVITSLMMSFKTMQDEFEAERANRRRDVAEAQTRAQQAQDEAAKARVAAYTAEQAHTADLGAANERIERLQLAFNASERDRLSMIDEVSGFKIEVSQTKVRYQQVIDALDKQAVRHDEEMTSLNNETFKQLSEMKFKTAAVQDMYEQVKEEQQKQGKELMELRIQIENARKILLGWGLNPDQVEGLLAGAIEPAQVEKCVHAELEKHLTQTKEPAPLPENVPLPPMSSFQSEVTAPAIQSVTEDKPPDSPPVVAVKIEEKVAIPPEEKKPNE